jgi:hypothetical protein
MREDQRIELCEALDRVHSLIHDIYPNLTPDATGQFIRHKLLVGDLAVHLVEEVMNGADFAETRVVERTANLLYAVRLVAPDHPLEKAAELLVDAGA